MRNQQFYVSGKRPIALRSSSITNTNFNVSFRSTERYQTVWKRNQPNTIWVLIICISLSCVSGILACRCDNVLYYSVSIDSWTRWLEGVNSTEIHERRYSSSGRSGYFYRLDDRLTTLHTSLNVVQPSGHDQMLIWKQVLSQQIMISFNTTDRVRNGLCFLWRCRLKYPLLLCCITRCCKYGFQLLTITIQIMSCCRKNTLLYNQMKQSQMLLEIVTYSLIGYQCIRISSVIILSFMPKCWQSLKVLKGTPGRCHALMCCWLNNIGWYSLHNFCLIPYMNMYVINPLIRDVSCPKLYWEC